MSVEIREYNETDREYITDAENKFGQYLHDLDTLDFLQNPPQEYGVTYVEEMMKKLAEHTSKIFIAESDGKNVGFSVGIMEEQTVVNELEAGKETHGRILELYVEPEYRGQGVGKLLMERMEGFLKEQGCTRLFLEVYAPNKDAYEVYKKLGYKDVSVDMIKTL